MSILNDVAVEAEPPGPSDLSIPAYLRDVAAVAMAVIARDGTLKDANRGFLTLTAAAATGPGPGPGRTTPNVRDLFVNPRFYQFAARQTARADRVLYRGTLNVGRGDGRVVPLKGTVYGHGDHLLLVVAEYDVGETERLNETLWRLKQDLEHHQRELARLERQVDHHRALSEAALRDRDTLLEALTPRDEKRDEEHNE
jgi:hypothetical protein